MRLDTCHILLIDKGDPYTKGERIQLPTRDFLIGRSWKKEKPDIAFDSLYVSRRHALIAWDGEKRVITDLGSKHGTQVNGLRLEPEHRVAIKHGDRIDLARGLIAMTYQIKTDFDDRTITMTNLFPKEADMLPKESDRFPKASDAMVIDLERREVRVEGVLLNFFGKERDLLLLLYRNRSKAVSYDEIRVELWPERRLDDGIPDVGNEEINALVYRLRKRLGYQGHKVVTIARFGVLLEI